MKGTRKPARKLPWADGSGYAFFPTALGRCGLAWTPAGIVRFGLPETSQPVLDAQLRFGPEIRLVESPPLPVARVIERVRAHLSGRLDDFRDIPLDLDHEPPFRGKVLAALREVGPGQVVTYGEMAGRVGKPKAARAVGQAMARNPVPLLVPCHRVVGSGGAAGGFSAEGGTGLKAKLLAIEGVALPESQARTEGGQPFDYSEAVRHLSRVDKQLGALIERVGPLKLEISAVDSPFQALVEAIVYQQLTGKAAATIFSRVQVAFGNNGILRPLDLIRASDEELQATGLSRPKIAAVRDLAEKTLAGEVPTMSALRRLDDEQVIETLTRIRGIGRWTAEMFLIFRLGRPDVLAVDDYGLRKGFAILYKRSGLPDRKEFQAAGEKWRPYRSAASWYLWRANEILGGI